MRPMETENRQLDGWKEIAGYLGRGVRTVQRWERLYGLPVRRLGVEGGEIVFAFRAEIDHWMESSGGKRKTVPGSHETTSVTLQPGEPSAVGSGWRESFEAGAAAPTHPKRQLLPFAWGALTVALLGAAVSGYYRDQDLRGAGARSLGQPTSWRVEADSLVVRDASGATLWSRRFGHPLVASEYHSGQEADLEKSRYVRIADLEGDGTREVIFVTRGERRTDRRLYCFEADGRLRFTLQPRHTVRFGDAEYSPPWLAHRIFLTDGAGGLSIWAVYTHSLWFPSLLQEVTPHGDLRQEYWSNGFVESVSEGTWRHRRVIFVGAADNEHRGASLAVLSRDHIAGSAPSEDPRYACRNCPPGRPLEFFVFPPDCISRTLAGIPYVVETWTEGRERMLVRTRGAESSATVPGMLGVNETLYAIDSESGSARAELGSGFEWAHDALEKTGQLDHSFDARDMRSALPVRRWDGGRFVPLSAGRDARADRAGR